MLRNILLTLGGALLVTGAMAGISGHWQAAAFMLVWGAILVFGILYERVAYKKILDQAPTGSGWQRTAERFVDPKSGKLVTVYVKPLTGERAYVAEGSAA
ncbi:hypothetical protein FHS83_000153 [Rhizomicrobium palustre]|uniref:Uncharacterized protein n=1 Tax=Rhizomicrobium palustre TaxID=189966 RepID=A0A846MUC3_9PROT|nr:hypothetical protein [Rhizomicrobium palustre]NIK86835.1 hypothetical protein [Rhizomicrobium palustre]